jgi:antitoxin (DNA-binding transcriptional repressor) of toxin-antitoxin stability system
MKEMSATEVARQFSEVLDAIEHRHQSFVVTRGGRAIATLGPVATAGGGVVKALLVKHKPDPAWATELQALRENLVVEERPWSG